MSSAALKPKTSSDALLIVGPHFASGAQLPVRLNAIIKMSANPARIVHPVACARRFMSGGYLLMLNVCNGRKLPLGFEQ